MPCTGYKCLPEIATSAYGLLAMTNLVAGAVGGVHRNLQLPMALTERRYIFLSRSGLVQRAPLQTQSVHTILTAACTNCKCLPEIATSAYGLLAMTNLVAGAVGGVHRNLQLPMALTERRYSQTWRRIRSAMPFPFRQCLPEIATSAYGLLAMTNLVAGAVGGVHRNLQLPMALTERRYSQTWRRIRSAMPFPFRQCLPEIATAPLGPRNDKLEGLAPQNACRKDCQPARRSLSAATFFSRAAALYNERRYRRNRCTPF